MNRILFFVLAICLTRAFSYEGQGHQTLTKAAVYVSLKQSNYRALSKFIEDNGYGDAIITASSEPDGAPLTLDEIKPYTEPSKGDLKKFDILSDKLSGVVPLKVSFTAINRTGEPVDDYEWNFGDGETSNGVSVQHIFNKVGNYSVKLQALRYSSYSDDVVATLDVILNAAMDIMVVPEYNLSNYVSIFTTLSSIDAFTNTIAEKLSTELGIGTDYVGKLAGFLKNKMLSEGLNPTVNNINALLSATQHTYVCYPGKDTYPPSKKFGEITISPFAAQIEYDLAKKALNGKKFSQASTSEKNEALRRLGRVMHYVEDVTVPHHCELPGNLFDLLDGLNKSAGSIDPTKVQASQTTYEGKHINDNYYFDATIKTFYRKDDNTNSFSQINWNYSDDLISDPNLGFTHHTIQYLKTGYLNNSPLKFCDNYNNKSIQDIITNTRNYVVDSRLMDFCDGISRYNFLARNTSYYSIAPLSLLWSVMYCKEFPKYFSRIYDRTISVPTPWCFFSCPLQQTTEFTVDDNLFYVSDKLVPLAITNCAKVIAKYFYETEGIKKDPDITPVINLLLND